MSDFDRRGALSTRAQPQLSAPCLKDCLRNVVVKDTTPIGVQHLGNSIANTTIDARSGWHNGMPWLVPSPAPPTCVANTFDQVKPDAVQTCLGQDGLGRGLVNLAG
eukprot:7513977-Pyramimonas_sp.AAC.1